MRRPRGAAGRAAPGRDACVDASVPRSRRPREVVPPLPSRAARRSHQQQNAALATACARRLLAIDDAAIERGLSQLRWPGRFEVVGNVILDGAQRRLGPRSRPSAHGLRAAPTNRPGARHQSRQGRPRRLAPPPVSRAPGLGDPVRRQPARPARRRASSQVPTSGHARQDRSRAGPGADRGACPGRRSALRHRLADARRSARAAWACHSRAFVEPA